MSIYTVLYASDDPYGSEFCSKPFMSAFDHCFTGAANYNKDIKMVDRYYEWGAKRADFWPQGICESFFKHLPRNNSRNINLVHIGNPQNKTKRILDIYKAFPKMALYGNSFGLKGLLRTYYHILKRKKGWYEEINPFNPWLIKMFLKVRSIEDPFKLYPYSKIGINIHQSSGPVNTRLFEFPACGVMQICDCPEGLGAFFEVGKEVVTYETTKEAIELIHYYLEHDDERRKIAAAGYKRVMKDYKRLDTFKVAIEKIKHGMLDKGIENFKDGNQIKVNKVLLNKYKI